MNTRFQAKNIPGGRLTPSSANTSIATNSTLSPSSPLTSGGSSESDQVDLGKIKLISFYNYCFCFKIV